MWVLWARDPPEPNGPQPRGVAGVRRMKGPRVGEAGEELRLLRAEEKGWCDMQGTGPQTVAAGQDAAPDAAWHLPEYHF